MRFKANQYGSFAAANENSQSIREDEQNEHMLRERDYQDNQEEEDEIEATHHQREVSQRIDHEVHGGEAEDNHGNNLVQTNGQDSHQDGGVDSQQRIHTQNSNSRFGHESEQKQDKEEDGEQEEDDIELYEVNLLADEESDGNSAAADEIAARQS